MTPNLKKKKKKKKKLTTLESSINQEKLAQYFKIWPKIKEKISFLLGKKSPKSKKYISFKPHLIYCTALYK